MVSGRYRIGRIDLSFYFENFKTTEYEINGKTYDLTNLTLRYRFRKTIKNYNYALLNYTISEGYDIQSISRLYYGSSEYTWLLILCNDILDPYFDFPLDYENFRKYIISKYGSWEYAASNIHHFERVAIYKNDLEKITDLDPPLVLDKKVFENVIVDGVKKYPDLPVLLESEKKIVYILDHEIQKNDKKREIKVIDKKYLNAIEEISREIFD